jgi:hypothetical protein
MNTCCSTHSYFVKWYVKITWWNSDRKLCKYIMEWAANIPEHALIWQRMSITGVLIAIVMYLQYEFCLSTLVLDLVYWISYGIWYEVHLCAVYFCVCTLQFWICILQGVVECLKIVTKAKSERIAKFAFDYATRNNRKKVTAVHKANIMKLGDGLFLKSCQEVCSKQN